MRIIKKSIRVSGRRFGPKQAIHTTKAWWKSWKIDCWSAFLVHCKKWLTIFPSPTGMSWPGRVWLVTSRLGTGKSITFIFSVHCMDRRFEYGEMNITKLNHRIDDIEDEIYREKMKIQKCADEMDDTFDDMLAHYWNWLKEESVTRWIFFYPSNERWWFLVVFLCRKSKSEFQLAPMKSFTNCEIHSSNPLQRACSGFLIAACVSKSCSVTRLWSWKLFWKPAMNVYRKKINQWEQREAETEIWCDLRNNF